MALVTNSGFETGDFTGWTNSGWSIDAVTVHAGSYSAMSYSSLGVLKQAITIPAIVNAVKLWAYPTGYVGSPTSIVIVRFNFTDETYEDVSVTNLTEDVWQQLTFTPTTLKQVASFEIRYQNSSWFLYIDDISLSVNVDYIIDYEEEQTWNVAIREVPMRDGVPVIDTSTFTITPKKIRLTCRFSEDEKEAFLALVYDGDTIRLCVGYWVYTVWLDNVNPTWEYKTTGSALRPWETDLQFTVKSGGYSP